MAKPPYSEQKLLKKGPWTPEEDKKMVDFIEKNGHGSWRALPKLAGLNRCGKSCRLRWTNYLRPDIKRGKFTDEEEQIIINIHSVLGNKWSAIASNLQGRTDNEIKNYWNTHLKKKLMNMGIDPVTHRPRTDHLSLFANFPQLLGATNLSNLMVNHDAGTQLANARMLQSLMQVLGGGGAQIPSNFDPNNHLFNNPTMNAQLVHDQRLFEYLRLMGNSGGNVFNDRQFADFNAQTNFLQTQNQMLPLSNETLETFSTNNNNLYGMDLSVANCMPPLVSCSSEKLNVDSMECKSMIDLEISNPSSTSTTYVETFGGDRIMDDETSDSYWKDIVE